MRLFGRLAAGESIENLFSGGKAKSNPSGFRLAYVGEVTPAAEEPLLLLLVSLTNDFMLPLGEVIIENLGSVGNLGSIRGIGNRSSLTNSWKKNYS